MSTSKPVTALLTILIASAASLAVAGPPTPADAGRQSGAAREGGARVKPAHLPTGPKPGSQPARRQEAASGQEGTDKLAQFDIQQATSQQQEAERLKQNAAKKTEDRVPKRTSDAIFGPSAPRGPTRNANGAARSSTIGASGIVPPEDSNH